jgi:hypothetical protein
MAMGRVVDFPYERALLPSAADRLAAAEVVIFPGVRIERRGVEPAERSDSSPSKPAGGRHSPKKGD